MNTSEVEQLSSMFNWAQGNEEIESIQVRMYKQYSDNTYTPRYSLQTHKWVNGKHLLIKGEGSTMIEAMRDLSGKM